MNLSKEKYNDEINVVSSFRVKDKSMFYKVAVHELLHSLGLPHCPQKDRTCYIAYSGINVPLVAVSNVPAVAE